MRRATTIRLFLCCGALAAVFTAAPLRAQIQIIPRARLDSIANPPTAAGAEVIRFDRTRIDIGSINELAEPSIHHFEWVNKGSKPVVITHVTTSCGCLTSSFDRQPVKPGARAVVTATFNPKGEAGQIDRKLFVYTQLSEKQPTAILRLVGTVAPSKATADGYPHALGMLQVSRTELRFDAKLPAQRGYIACRNAGATPLHVTCNEQFLPPGFRFTCEPATLAPGEKGRLTIGYEPTTDQQIKRIPLILQGLGVPPSQSTIRLVIE